MFRDEVVTDLSLCVGSAPDSDEINVVVDIAGVMVDLAEVTYRADRGTVVLRLQEEDLDWVLDQVERFGVPALRRRSEEAAAQRASAAAARTPMEGR